MPIDEKGRELDGISPQDAYLEILREFCASGTEECLYRASLLSQQFISAGLPPDEIVAMHTAAVQAVVKPHDPRALVSSQQLLLEVMIAYGVRYSEYAEFRLMEAKKAAEAEHLRADVATKGEQERIELLAVISHELGNPLTIAKGNVSAIRRFLAENNRLSHDLSTRAIDAEVAIERLLSLREELMAASRQEPRELELGPIMVDSAVIKATKWAGPAASDKNIDLHSEFHAKHNLVIGEPDALQSIFGNLLSNAIRYTPAGGRVSVVTLDHDDEVVVEIRDTGIGFDPAVKAHLFERFYRAAEAKQVAVWGLGLGLAIANELAQALGARLSADGELGKGATFRVSFPRANGDVE